MKTELEWKEERNKEKTRNKKKTGRNEIYDLIVYINMQ
jgi:hypothetical protein